MQNDIPNMLFLFDLEINPKSDSGDLKKNTNQPNKQKTPTHLVSVLADSLTIHWKVTSVQNIG